MCTNRTNTNNCTENSIFNFEPQQSRCRCQSEEVKPRQPKPCSNKQAESRPASVSQNVFLTGDFYQIKEVETLNTNDAQLNQAQTGCQMNPNCRVRQAYMQGYRQGYRQGHANGCRQGYRKGFKDGYCQGVQTANWLSAGESCCRKEAEFNTGLSNSATNGGTAEEFFLF